MAKIEVVDINSISPNDENPRKIDKSNFKQLVKSIEDFPEMLHIRPIVIDDNNTILGGNQRYHACKALGYDKIPILRADNLTAEQYNEFVLKDNMLLGKWDINKLLEKWDQDLIDKVGLEVPKIIMANMKEEEGINIDEYNKSKFELTYNMSVTEGDIVDIGRHRLLCGDSTKAENYKRLFRDKHPFLMVTDPPYGVDYDPKQRVYTGLHSRAGRTAAGAVRNDDRFDWSDAITLFNGNVIYMWHASNHSVDVGLSLIKNGFILRQMIIWNKDSMTIGRSHYHYKHEPCWYAVKKGASAKWNGG